LKKSLTQGSKNYKDCESPYKKKKGTLVKLKTIHSDTEEAESDKEDV